MDTETTIVGAVVVILLSQELSKRLNGKSVHRYVLERLGRDQARLRVIGEFKAKGRDCGSTYVQCRPLDPQFGRDILSICRDFVRVVVPVRNEDPAQKIRPRRNAQAIAAQAL